METVTMTKKDVTEIATMNALMAISQAIFCMGQIKFAGQHSNTTEYAKSLLIEAQTALDKYAAKVCAG